MKLRKREKSQRTSVVTAVRTPLIQSAGVLSYVILLLMRIPLSKAIGDAGMGLFAPAFEIFIVITLITSYSVTGAMSGVVRYRVKREQHGNAKRVFSAVFWMDLLISAVVATVLVLASTRIAEFWILEALSKMVLFPVAPAIVFAAVI